MSLETDSYTRRRVPLHVPVPRRFPSSLSVSPPSSSFSPSVSLFVATESLLFLFIVYYEWYEFARRRSRVVEKDGEKVRAGSFVFFFHPRGSPADSLLGVFFSRRDFTFRFHADEEVENSDSRGIRWDSTDNERWDISVRLDMLRVRCFLNEVCVFPCFRSFEEIHYALHSVRGQKLFRPHQCNTFLKIRLLLKFIVRSSILCRV